MKRSFSVQPPNLFHVAILSVTAGIFLTQGGCSWGRFNKLKDDAPAERIDPPKKYSEPFGTNLAVVETDEVSFLYVGTRDGIRGGLSYNIGRSEDPDLNPEDSEHCLPDDEGASCKAIVQAAGLNLTWAPPGEDPLERCFVSGVGKVGKESGLWARCYDGTRFVLQVNATILSQLLEPVVGEPRVVRLSSNRKGEQILFAASQNLKVGWYYQPLSRSPIEVPVPKMADDSLGSAVSVLKTSNAHLLAWAAEDEGQVFLFRVSGETVEPLGCLGGLPLFGRALASGDVDGDGQDDLVVADDTNVSVFSGAALDSLPVGDASECSLADLPESALLVQVSCENDEDTSGCASSEFGEAVAVFDSDGDGTGEIAVGAPKMNVRGKSQAGAVLVYAEDGTYLSTTIASDGDDGAKFGSSLSPVAQETREILAIGAEGGRRVYLQYCAGQADSDVTGRCH